MGKTRLMMGVAIVTASVMLSGCGGSSPEDTVTSYIDAWNSGDLKGVVTYADKDLSKQIQDHIDYCIENKMGANIDKKIDLYMDEVNKKWKTNNPLINEPNPSVEEKKELEKKMTEIRTDDSLSHTEKIEKSGILLLETIETTKGLDKKMSPTAYQFFAFMTMNKILRMQGVDRYTRNEYFKKLVLNDMKKSGDDSIAKSQKICEVEFFKPDSIKNVNVIEVKEKSPDKQIVRVELVKSGDSVKKAIRVELVNKKWVVTTAL